MKLLITGATGFIGKHLVKSLLEEGDEVAALVREKSDTSALPEKANIITLPSSQTELENILLKEKFDGVIHLASLYLMSHKSEDIAELIDSNVKFGTQVIDAAAKSSVRFFINTGSFAQHFENKPYSPINLYAATKQAFQDIAQFYADTTDLSVMTLELFNTYGPEDTRDKVFNLWYKAIKNQTTLDMSPGEQIIDTSYIDDVVSGFKIAAKIACAKKQIGSVFALTSPERMTLKELSGVFADTLNAKLNINFGALPYRERETMVPMEKTPTLPGWTPKINLREGISRTFKK